MRYFLSHRDKKLQDTYIPLLVAGGNNISDSKKIFKRLLKLAKKESRLEGTSNLPKNYGNFILEQSLSDGKTKAYVENLRKDGVTNKDIKWWWNMDDLERRIIEKIDDNIRIVSFRNYRKDGMSEEEAAEKGSRLYPIYGDPSDKPQATGDDRPLPYELKNRINIYIEKRSSNDTEEYKEEIGKTISFNALVRREIRKGKI